MEFDIHTSIGILWNKDRAKIDSFCFTCSLIFLGFHGVCGPEGQGITVTTVGCLLVRGLGGSEGRALEHKLSYFRLRNELENNYRFTFNLPYKTLLK